MPVTAGSIPGFAPNTTLAVLMLVANDDPEVAKILDLAGGIAGFKPCKPGLASIKVIEERKRIVTAWNSRPGQTLFIDAEKMTNIDVKAFHMKLGLRLDDSVIEGLREWTLGETPQIIADAKAEAEQFVVRGMAQRTRIIMRSYAKLLVAILTSTTLVYNQDDATVSIDNPWLPTVCRKYCAADWRVSSTNLLSEWQTFLEDFIILAGGPPTHLHIGRSFVKQCVAGNAFIADFVSANPGFLSAAPSLGRILGLANFVDAERAAELDTMQVVTVGLWDADNAAEVWPSSKIMLSRNAAGRAITHRSPRTLDAAWQTGLYLKEWREDDPTAEIKAVGLGAIPAVEDWTQIMICDVNNTGP